MSKVAELAAHVPWVDKDGLPTREFIAFIQQLYERIGGVAALTSDELTAIAGAATSRDSVVSTQAVADLARIFGLSEKSQAMQKEIDDLKTQVAILSNARADRDMTPSEVVGIQHLTNRARIVRYASGWNDYLIPSSSFSLGATSPTLTVFRGNCEALAFSGTGPTETIHGDVHYLHDIDRSFPVFPHLHTSHIVASPTGDYKFTIEHTRATIGDTFPATSTLSLVQTAQAQYEHVQTEASDAQAFTGVDIDMLTLLTVSRDASDVEDTFENDVYLFQVDIHYLSDGKLTFEKTMPFSKRSY